MELTPDAASQLIGDTLFEQWRTERHRLDDIDRWARWDHDEPHRPRHATAEYKELAKRAQAPWGDLIVGSVAQTLYVEGYKRPDAPDDSTGWDFWQANGMDARQIAIHRAVLTYGLSYGTCLPGQTLTGDTVPVMRGVSPREMLAVYDDPANDDWAQVAIRVKPLAGGAFRVWVWDDMAVHEFKMADADAKPEHVASPLHGAGVTPVVRYANRFDLEGRSSGEIEPFIPLLGRIDQTSFDRLVVQRFASWIVRTIAGMDVPETAQENGVTTTEVMHRLRVEDILTAEDPETRFGSLPATPLDGFIKAKESDLTDLAAVSQTPAFEMLGSLANMSADALAAAKASQTAKSDEAKHLFGEAHERFIRLACHISGDRDGASDFNSQVRWADTSVRSLAQAVDAYGKLVQMLGFPAELLWSKVPGITQLDAVEAKRMREELDPMQALLEQFSRQTQPTT